MDASSEGVRHFSYLLDRIRDAQFEDQPFPHLYLEDFLAAEDFRAVTESPDLRLPESSDVDQLFTNLETSGYEIIPFPGCTQSKAEYLTWLNETSTPGSTHPACEAQGMALRMARPTDPTVQWLNDFFRSPDLASTLRAKFDISRPTTVEAGLQKYLNGYEISPHPDIRKKALTWMLNVNPAADSELLDIHTHFMTMLPQWSFVTEFWRYNRTVDTCWVPWAWCSTVRRQVENNSISIFSPRWDTLHAIRAHYDHLKTQRTQFYGNLWYEVIEPPLTSRAPQFREFDLTGPRERTSLASLVRSPRRVAQAVNRRVFDRRST